jgi:hypothetical protein
VRGPVAGLKPTTALASAVANDKTCAPRLLGLVVQRSARRAVADRLDAVHPCAMRDDGKVLLNEIIRPAGEPIPESTFPDLTMLLFLHGRERTEAEYCQLLDSAGLRLHNVTPTASNPP